MKLLSEKEIEECFIRFEKENPHPECELNFRNAYTLLVAVVLSAQTTDKSVNKVTEKLFEEASSPSEMIAFGEEKLSECIKPIGLYRNKSKNIINLSEMLLEQYDGAVPSNFEKLVKLPGVGRKTANVVLNVFFKEKTMPVDTHILRISPRIGLAEGNEPLEIEKALLKRIPEKYLLNAHHHLLLHGRYVCTAKNPACENCLICDLCRKNF